ncbi:cytochrome c oxidase assembly protein [Neobacillus cucumis]|uniref:cytochrome c oxidase assembly protein n=1 Tax=Neobacillus cucumis TaxID=1740721 RepID=UPI001962BBB8|nr:cytochrome c oxidase assembly protein [Neobacillus cucumis]MBM7652125.1 putative membrane protein [Neobacillus cucumis]
MLEVFFLEGQLEWNIPLLVILIGIGVSYVVLLRIFTDNKIYHQQPVLFFFSLTLLYLIIGSPFSTLNHLSISLHMLQMSVLFFVIPPLLILSIPSNFPPISIAFNIPPTVPLITFAVMFFSYHLQVVLTYLSLHPFIHNSYLILLLLLSFFIWQPIVKKHDQRFAFLSGIVLLPACSLLILNGLLGDSENPLMSGIMSSLCMSPSTLSSLHILPAPFNTRGDLILAGILMMGMHKFALLLTIRLKNKVQPGNS